MSVITPTKLTIGGVPIEFQEGHTIEIDVSRGMEPSTMTVLVARDKKADRALQALNNPVTIKLECADFSTVGKDTIEFKKWSLLSRRGREQGMVAYTFADVRWANSYNKLTAEYNIVSYGGLYRPNSTKNGAAYKALFAAEDALKKLGYDVDVDAARFTVGTVQLPDNQGNDPVGGGWVAATQDESIPKMTEACAADPVPLADGTLALVDRFTENSKDLDKYARAMGGQYKASVLWQEPAKIIIPFRKRIERQLRYSEGATSSRTDWDFACDNVMPDWNPANTGGPEDHEVIADWMNDTSLHGVKYLGGSLAEFRKRYLKRQTFDIYGALTAQQLDALLIAQSLVRQCYRLRFRVRRATSSGLLDDVRGNYSDIRLERLQKDGTGKPTSVFMDYTRQLRFGRLLNANQNPLDAYFSETVNINYDNPAPAKARWLDRENLVFEIVFDSPDDRQVTGYLPGRLSKRLSYTAAGFAAAVAGKAKFQMQDNAELTGGFNAAVFWHGLWTKHGKGDQARTYDIEIKGYPGSRGRPALTMRVVHDMTANFQYKTGGGFPGTLLNGRELRIRAKQMADEVKASLTQKRAGISTHVGIGVLTKGKVWVGGDIHRVQILIGARKMGSVETRVTVLPGRRPEKKGPVTGRRGEAAVESARII